MTELKIKWEEFIKEIDSLSKDGNSLLNSNPRGKDEEKTFVNEYNLWREKIIEFLNKSFGENNEYTKEFKYAHKNKFKIQGQQNNSQINLREIKQDFRNDIRYIDYNKNILKVSDLITKPSQIDLTIRENYTSEDILELILEKLYDLYDDTTYEILPILEGNGIKLGKRREEFDYVKLLENNGYVRSNNIGQFADAQLTINGKLYIEEKRKKTEPNYQSISDDKETIELKIDELLKKLEKLGFGQQIIFDELDELKDLYSTLNKKNWGELVKGKIVDLGLSQAINEDMMKLIYEHITNDILRIP
ncbi:hypothetical protein [Winogradskyella vidalii]|uniref:hypothetical protein n=1 Tax=Winogradskyella vidalii TaxID=2615024 RepID=UPI0015CC68E5|nr:hypothetical protein [Winogradskyella vidalii]